MLDKTIEVQNKTELLAVLETIRPCIHTFKVKLKGTNFTFERNRSHVNSCDWLKEEKYRKSVRKIKRCQKSLFEANDVR